MDVDSIGIFETKGPYCPLIITYWFFQALAVIHRESWGDVARRFIMVRRCNLVMEYATVRGPGSEIDQGSAVEGSYLLENRTSQRRAPSRQREHCDVLSMQIDSDLVIYRTTLLRTFQVVTNCPVDKSEVLVVLISPHDSKRH
ncbi:serine carboxypeptidase-like 33 [Dorcoceras hygrometricum]|uniref:Serine carboxypeptidase-like 33 n=1 Tax=Dorcoceras hygrometricum TaxID=472368 RepID=A0A2Z7A366_9LAMI|nr:serine carboxypeptidase-like 33 [Dorcoceras hygrometricum]